MGADLDNTSDGGGTNGPGQLQESDVCTYVHRMQ